MRVGLVSFGQESALAEAGESTVSPQAGVSSSVVVASGDSTTDSVSTADLVQVVIGDESLLVVEESEALEDTAEVARSWSFTGEDAFLVFGDGRGWNSQFGDALLTGQVQVVTSAESVLG